MPSQTTDEEHPRWCDPAWCLSDSPDAHQRHRSEPGQIRLEEDACGTRLVAWVAESVCTPGEMRLEIDVFTDDSDEPHHELGIAFKDLLELSKFCLTAMVDSVAAEAQSREFTASDAG